MPCIVTGSPQGKSKMIQDVYCCSSLTITMETVNSDEKYRTNKVMEIDIVYDSIYRTHVFRGFRRLLYCKIWLYFTIDPSKNLI